MKLYTFAWSSNARKAEMTALSLNLQIERIVVDLQKRQQLEPEYLRINPSGRVPTLVDDTFVLWESTAIMQYLCDKRPGNTLYPTDLRLRMDVNRWLSWSGQHWSTHIAALNFEHFIRPMMNAGPANEARVKLEGAALEKSGALLDAHLGSHGYVCGNALSLADLACAAPLMYMAEAKLPLTHLRHVGDWLRRVQQLEAWQKTEPKRA